MKEIFTRGLALLVLIALPAMAAKDKKKDPKKDEAPLKDVSFSGMKLRGIGPALTSGRISDFAVHPQRRHEYFVAVSSGGVWWTGNDGTTWKPVFDGEGSYSIGCVTIDQQNPFTVWVGTGENNSQRSVAYGDGIYKSVDGGKTWKNMGLKDSQHIGQIVVHPEDSNTVYVASQGPLWSAGGDRGLYKTSDGGNTWERILHVSEHTGISEIHMDPKNPDTLYAVAYQRRRHVWTLINGGPESGLHKSTDGGKTWKKLKRGLPSVDIGRIGLAVSPAQDGLVYAIVEAAEGKSGFFRSLDGGESFKKMNNYVSGSGQYYQEIFADPVEPGTVYSMDTWLHRTMDGGKTFKKVNERFKHVDNHAMVINPKNNDHILVGCDGGIYESYDRGLTWDYKPNLPITQFYKVGIDNDTPFYNVYGGTQDNFTLGGPSRTTHAHGIANRDWFVTLGGDGFKTVVDPKNPDIVYSQFQYGGLNRYDRKSGELITVKPQVSPSTPPLRWNWDAPLMISPHSNTRLYYGANILFRSDDRGNTWKAISPDLSRQLDRNQLKVMDRIWNMDAVAKNRSTSQYGNLVSVSESPLQENLLYAGSDDGLIHVSQDGGENWRKLDRFPGVPERTYVNDIEASFHDANTVYAAFNNHKMGDFKPYVLKSTDRGNTWTSISGNLPERGSVYALAEDHVNPNLLFAGTEFGVFFSSDGGAHWQQLKAGIPTIAVRDIEIQRRENDLVLASFGRGFFILDDYSPLRETSREKLDAEAQLFAVKDPWMFVESVPLGLPGSGFQGDNYYTAPNPEFGAIFTYYLKEKIQTEKQKRRKQEKKASKDGGDVTIPDWAALEAEAREEKPSIVLIVRDEMKQVVRRLTGPASAGFHRIAWDLRFPASNPTNLRAVDTSNPFASQPIGPMVTPGTYSVELYKRVGGVMMKLSDPQSFTTKTLNNTTLPAKDRDELLAFQKKTARLQRAILGAQRTLGELNTRVNHLKKAIQDTPAATEEHDSRIRVLQTKLADMRVALTGDPVRRKYQQPQPPSIISRIQSVVYGHWTSTSAPTTTQRDAYRIAANQFELFLNGLRQFAQSDLAKLESELEAIGAPWTPGRIPTWTKED